jgi:alkylhydroperoxidase family enzyme
MARMGADAFGYRGTCGSTAASPSSCACGSRAQQLHSLPQPALRGGGRGGHPPGEDRHPDRVVLTDLHSEAQQAALRYTEALTRAADTDPNAAFHRFDHALVERFTPEEMLESIAVVVNMNGGHGASLARPRCRALGTSSARSP